MVDKKVLFQLPDKEEFETFLSIISKDFKIDKNLLEVMFKYFKRDLFFILNILAGKTIKFPAIKDLDSICQMIKIYKEMTKIFEYNMHFDKVISILAKKYNVSSNVIFAYYNEMKNLKPGKGENFEE